MSKSELAYQAELEELRYRLSVAYDALQFAYELYQSNIKKLGEDESRHPVAIKAKAALDTKATAKPIRRRS